MAYPTFPELTRKPALKTRGTRIDTTLRDPMSNGAEASRASATRRRRQWEYTIDALTPADYTALEEFVENVAEGGANPFLFQDLRDPTNPQTFTVRFSTIPAYQDAGSLQGEFRQNCTFTIREL